MKASIAVGALAMLVVSCASSDEPAVVDRASLNPVTLPNLSRLEDSVQSQLRERHTALTTKRDDRQTSADDLGKEYGEMGRLLMVAGFSDLSEAALLNAEALAPRDMRWPYYLGHLYRERGDIPRATAAFERALRWAPSDAPTLTWLGEAALDEGRADMAEPLFAKALSLQPRSAAAHYGLGRTALARLDYARAVTHLQQALALDSTASVIHYPLAMAFRGLGDHQQAEAHLRQRGAAQIRPDPLKKELEDLLHSALTYEKNADVAGARGDWSEATNYLRKAVALAPTRASPRHKLGTALFYMGDRATAREQFLQAVRLSPSFAQSHYALGVIHEDAGELRQAIESYSSAVKYEPLSIDARLGLANALRRSGRLDQSLSEYDRILTIDPGAVRARFGYAATLVRLQRYRAASDRFAEAMDLYPNELAFARAAARLFAAAPDDRVRDGRRAMAIGQSLAQHQPRTIDLEETLAMASAEVGQYDEAVKWQRAAIESAGRTGRRDAVARLTENLARYQAGRPCRLPWREDEPIEYY